MLAEIVNKIEADYNISETIRKEDQDEIIITTVDNKGNRVIKIEQK